MQAKYPKELRAKWYLWVEKHGHSVVKTCKMFKIKRKIYYYWYRKDHGFRANQYKTPKDHPNLKLTTEVKRLIEKEKLKTNYGPKKMSLFLKRRYNLNLSSTIIYRYYKKKMLIRKSQKKLPWYKPLKKKLLIKAPGEGIQVDVKYVYNKQGKRKFQFSFLDVYTRKYYFEIFNERLSKNAILAHRKAERSFGFKIRSVQTDNVGEFRGGYHTWLRRNNISHYFIPKSSPYWNPNVERVHRTIDDEFYLNPRRPWKTPKEWLNYYNTERIHLSLNGLTPEEKLKSVTIEC